MIKNILILICLSGASLQAATVTFTQNFTINKDYSTTGSTTEVVNTNFFTASLNSFDPALGTLHSFTITWSLAGTFSGVISQPGGGISSGYSGDYSVQSYPLPTDPPSAINWSGGGGNGGGGPGGTPFNLPLTSASAPLFFTRTFAVSVAGVDYDQAVRDAVTGSGPVILRWNTPLIISGNADTLNVTANGSAELTYTYTPAPEVSSSLLALGTLGMGLIRRRR